MRKEKLLFLLFFCALAATALYFAWRAAPVTVVEKQKSALTTRLTQADSEPFVPWTGSTPPVPAAPTQGPRLILPVPPPSPDWRR